MELNEEYRNRILALLAALLGVAIATPAPAASRIEAPQLSVQQKLAVIRQATSEAMQSVGSAPDESFSKDLLLAQLPWGSQWNNWGNWTSWNSWASWTSYWGNAP